MSWLAKFTSLVAGLCLLFLGACGGGTVKDNEIIFWHAMSGELAQELGNIVADFNSQNPDIKVKVINKGSYEEAMNAAIAAYRSHNAPDIMQIYEVGTATMMHSGGVIKPVFELMHEAGMSLDAGDFLPAVAAYYTDNRGRLLSMPFNSSTAILYYNRDAFKAAGLDPERAPKTFAEVKQYAGQLVSNPSGKINCGLTTTWPEWILIENGSLRHNADYATLDNGFGGLGAEITLAHPYYKQIFTDLAGMIAKRQFVYGGRGDKPNELFISGQCAMLLDTSGNYADIKKNSRFNFAVGELPYYRSLISSPKNAVIGGGSLWVFNGKSPVKYANIAKFFKYLASPEIAARWHQKTGYVPVTRAAYALSRDQGFYAANPDALISVRELSGRGGKRGIRLGNLPTIRDLEAAALEKLFNGEATVDEVIMEIETKANQKLREFARSHQ